MLGDKEMEEGNDCALKLHAMTHVDGGGRERLPDDVLTNVGRDEERNARTETVTLLEELIQTDHDNSSHEKLDDDEHGVAGTEVGDVSVHTGEHIGHRLTNGDKDTEQFLGALEEDLVLAGALVHVDELRASKKLHDKTRGHNRANAELHEGSPVRGQDHAHPVERVRRLRGLDSVKRDLATDEVDEQGDDRPEDLLLDGNFLVGRGHFGQHAHERLDQGQESDPCSSRHG
mmetsp:Transcript_36342/g.82890  ORF Transcript_36342/g.82890 Transcript_36342/m.82890 type:complete len:231 (+) Transcript_36342:882-1574(+)